LGRAQRQVGAPIELGAEFRRAGAEQASGQRLIRGPHDGARAVRQGQEGKRAVLHETLPRGRLVRPGRCHGGNDGSLSVRRHGRGQAGGRPHRRLCAVGAHHQARTQRTACRRDLHTVGADLERHEGLGLDVAARLRKCLEQRGLQQPILDDVAEVRLPDVRSIEHQRL
jgi:hypothetical protein